MRALETMWDSHMVFCLEAAELRYPLLPRLASPRLGQDSDERTTRGNPRPRARRTGDGASEAQIENVRVRVLGRAGELTEIMRRMREVPNAERPAMGRLVNEIKGAVEARIAALTEELSAPRWSVRWPKRGST